MAEGRSIANLDFFSIPTDHLHVLDLHSARHEGVSVTATSDGLVLFIPRPRYIGRAIARAAYRGRNRLVTLLYPAPPSLVAAFVAFFVVYVASRPEDSFWRNSAAANFYWDIDECCLPFKRFFPNWARVAYLSVFFCLTVVLILMFIQRLWLRVLLSYGGWLRERRPGIITKLWALSLKAIYMPQRVLGGRHPLLYSFQGGLPSLPVPPLSATINQYLDSVKPLLSDEEFSKTKELAVTFQKTTGSRLQRYLWAKKIFWAHNYVSDWWLKFVYLASRDPLIINSNYYGLGYAYYCPSSDQLSRAASLVHYFCKFKQLLDREELEPQLVRGTVPLCMDQYRRIFSMTRVPGRECDTLVQSHASKHIVVLCEGVYFKVEVYHPASFAILTPWELRRVFVAMVAQAKATPPTAAEASIAAFTTDNRTKWAENRETHLSFGVNHASLHEIEAALFVLVLDPAKPKGGDSEGWSQQAKNLLCGNGVNRWCDKSFNLVVFANGIAGMHCEHAWADAPVMAHCWEWSNTGEISQDLYDKKTGLLREELEGDVRPGPAPRAVRLQWQLHPAAATAIQASLDSVLPRIADLQTVVFEFGQTNPGEFAAAEMKKCSMSPDAFIQMALQLAYRRHSGNFCLTYESSMTRLFLEGRTETIRTLSEESCAFVNAMLDSKASNEERVKKLHAAADRHTRKSRDAMSGRGCDRHLFALYVMGRGLEVPEDSLAFLKNALSLPWTLSSSQIPSQQCPERWPKWEGVDLAAPSGGFGPVSDNGYGVSYMVWEKHLFFHVSCKVSSDKTDSPTFVRYIKEALRDIRALFPPTEAAKVKST
mmetsp:Transcript_35190/g.80282  ORF Transcript_35190/g.80282 Transcript_35190/m.80282 type:complete len:822 (+) Transcript_35190:17-2482(+)